MASTDLEVRVSTLEKHVARLLEELDRAQAVGAIRRGYDAALEGRMQEAGEAFETLRQKHNIPRA
ncbi:MAG TPA: hypothetical protein VH253_00505 [Phycisphaerae bacterium]|nr:hypothetical protein [Phycisphaerae bacterium]